MKCYNHPDRESVATCQNCGKFLCKECAEKYQPCLCDDCYKKLRQKEIDNLKAARMQIKKTFIISSVLAIICVIIALVTGPDSFPGIFIVIAFFLPWGWKYSNLLGLSWFFKLNPTGIIFMVIFYILKAFIAAIVGIFCFIAAMYKYWKIKQAEQTAEIEMDV